MQLGHVAYRVKDLQKTLDFYCKGLGFPEMFRLYKEGTGELWIVYVKVAERQFLEFFPEEFDGQTDGQSYQHLALHVDDMDKTVEEITSRGITMDIMPMKGLDGNVQAWIVDPDGNRIELMQLMPGCDQLKY